MAISAVVKKQAITIISKYGQDVILRRKTSTYDPATGTATTQTAEETVKAIISTVKLGAEVNVTSSDISALISGAVTCPQLGDEIVVDSMAYTVVHPTVTNYAQGVAITSSVRLRK